MAVARITRASTVAAMQSTATRMALRLEAERRAARANALGSSEGVKIDAKVSEGTRPKGRPYARVESTNVGQEYGDRKTERRRILGRVAEEG